MKILEFPLSRITFSFVFGVLFSQFVEIKPILSWLLLTASFLVFLTVYFLSNKDKIPKNYFGIAVFILSFFIGISTVSIHNQKFNPANYNNQITDFDQKHIIEIVLRERLKSSAYSERFIALVKQVDTKESSGKILVNLYKDSLNHEYGIGQQLQFSTKVISHKKPNNPNQFDYGKYLTSKSILAQVYVAPNELKIGTIVQKDIWYYSDLLRNKIKNRLEKNHFGKEELAVAMALLLGQQQEISSEIIQDYQLSGAVHILSVSGLHVGLLMLFINFLLKPLRKNRFNSYLKLAVIISTLWFFAFIAGLSPSVVRSVTMFTFVAIGMHLNRKTNIFHTLLVSIFLILLFQPAFIVDIGFQLSYLALFFILWLQPLLASLWKPKTKVGNYVWEILTVSFAAQIGAFPLSIYYFHQFPGLFFVTNLAVLPLVSIIMYWGIFVLIIASFTDIPQFFTKALEYLIYFMNQIIKWVASVEQFIIQDISFNSYMLFSSFVLIFGVIIWFKKPTFSKLTIVLIGILCFQLSYFLSFWKHQKTNELLVFNNKRSTLISEKKNSQLTIYSDISTLKDLKNNKTIKPYLVANFSEIKNSNKLPNVLYFENKKILIVDSLGIIPDCNADILVLTHSPKINLERVFKTWKPKEVVVDASNYKTYSVAWKATCEKEKIPFHNTVEKGFYRVR
jgi:competence protein ComEC